jgi:hypothetical protein
MNKSLELAEGRQLIDSVARLAQLSNSNNGSSTDANSEAEKAGLREYIKNQLFEHAAYVLGCWFAVKSEYEPLCNAFASIANRAKSIQAQRAAASEQADAPTPTPTEATPTEEPRELVAPPGAPLVLSRPILRKR